MSMRKKAAALCISKGVLWTAECPALPSRHNIGGLLGASQVGLLCASDCEQEWAACMSIAPCRPACTVSVGIGVHSHNIIDQELRGLIHV